MLGYWWFAEREVDIAVVEVGAGGRFDATNVIDPIVSVITSVGLDHLVTLGPTIADIAWHKAGIIKAGGTAVIGDVPAEALAVIAEEARIRLGGPAFGHRDLDASSAPRPPIERADSSSAMQSWRLPWQWSSVSGDSRFQMSAIAAGIELGAAPRTTGADARDRRPACLDRWRAQRGQDRGHYPRGHPPSRRWPAAGHRPRHVEQQGSRRRSSPSSGPRRPQSCSRSRSFTARDSLAADTLARAVANSGFAGAIHVEPDPDAAVRLAEVIARADGAAVLVTGSMYLAGQVRRRWFPDQEIVLPANAVADDDLECYG